MADGPNLRPDPSEIQAHLSIMPGVNSADGREQPVLQALVCNPGIGGIVLRSQKPGAQNTR